LQEHYNKLLNFWNLVETYNADVVVGNESWLRREICKAKIFWADFTTSKEVGVPVEGEYNDTSANEDNSFRNHIR